MIQEALCSARSLVVRGQVLLELLLCLRPGVLQGCAGLGSDIRLKALSPRRCLIDSGGTSPMLASQLALLVIHKKCVHLAYQDTRCVR